MRTSQLLLGFNMRNANMNSQVLQFNMRARKNRYLK